MALTDSQGLRPAWRLTGEPRTVVENRAEAALCSCQGFLCLESTFSSLVHSTLTSTPRNTKYWRIREGVWYVIVTPASIFLSPPRYTSRPLDIFLWRKRMQWKWGARLEGAALDKGHRLSETWKSCLGQSCHLFLNFWAFLHHPLCFL